jgi:hypothetical protein
MVAVLLLSPLATSSLAAQAAAPESHVLTVTYVQMPFALAGEFLAWNDKYNLARDKKNPHILSQKSAIHAWGNAEQTLWVITEYKDLAGIQQANEWDDAQFRKEVPDSAQRAAITKEFQDKFGQYFAHHVDTILSARVSRMKP